MASTEAVNTEANPSFHHDVTPAHEPESASDICRLPFELLPRVLAHLPLADRAHAAMSCSPMRHAVNSIHASPPYFPLFSPPSQPAPSPALPYPISTTLHSPRSAPLFPPSIFPSLLHSSLLPTLPFLDLKDGSPCLNDAEFSALFPSLPSFSFPHPLLSSPSLLPALTFLDLKAGSPCLNDAAFTALCSRLGAAGIGDAKERRAGAGAGIEEGGGGAEGKGGMGKRGAGRKRGRAGEEEKEEGRLLHTTELHQAAGADCWHLSDKCTSVLPESIEELALCGADRHTDALIHGLVARLGPNLTKFAFSGFSRSIGSGPFVSLLSVSSRLVSLAIDGGEGLDVDTIVIFAGRNCPFLKELSVYDISMASLVYLASCHLSHLTRFRHKRRHRGVGVSDSLLLRLMLLWPRLEELVLVDKAESVGQGRAEEALTDTGLLMLTAWVSSLASLNLYSPSLPSLHPSPLLPAGPFRHWSPHAHRLCYFSHIPLPAPSLSSSLPHQTLTDTGLLMLTAWASSLTSLTLSLPSLSASKSCSEVALMQVASACTSLTHLDLSNFRCMSDPPLHEFEFVNQVISHLPSLRPHTPVASACTSLTHLDLSNFRCMSDPPLHEFISHSPFLAHPSFAAAPIINQCLLGPSFRCPSLAHLSLAGAPITDACLDPIASHSPFKLSYSLLHPLPHSPPFPALPLTRPFLSSRCTHHQCLFAPHSLALPPLRSCCSSYPIPHCQRCPALAHLSLAGAPITDASLDLIASHCPNLQSLSIKCCRKLLEPGVSALARCTRLQSLNAALVPGVTEVSALLLFQGSHGTEDTGERNGTRVLNQSPLPDVSLLSLSSHCHGLEELALHGCPRLNNEGLKALAASCLALRYLSLSFCDQVSDAGIISIANRCRHLIKIRLDGCRQLSNPCVRALCRPAWAQQVRPEQNQVRGSGPGASGEEVIRLPGEYAAARLRYLSMQSCPKISDDIFDHLLAAPALRFVDVARARLTEWAIHSFHSRRPEVELCISGVPYTPPVDY
ncbi:unnamed protein product [Closterium sp. NIES-65]|nr:unnamed protein product [Closterium sp. NIES-65]